MFRQFILSIFASSIGFMVPAVSEPTQLLLVRHGETDWNKENRYQGQKNNPLNEVGLAQAQALAKVLPERHPDVTAIYSSDLDRAFATAEATASEYNLPVIKTEALREIQWGDLDGSFGQSEMALVFREKEQKLKETGLDRKLRWDHVLVPGSESYNALLHRMQNQLMEIARKHPGEKVLVFTHGRAISTLIRDILDDETFSQKAGNCAVVYFSVDAEKPDSSIEFDKMEDLIVRE